MDPDPGLADLLSKIDAHGWAVRHVFAGDSDWEPCFTYTVGLLSFGHPEIAIVGLCYESAAGFANLIGDLVRNGRVFRADTMTRDLTRSEPVGFIDVLDTTELIGVEQVYGRAGRVSALQMIWSDSRGRFPWDEGWANPPMSQLFWGLIPDQWELDDIGW